MGECSDSRKELDFVIKARSSSWIFHLRVPLPWRDLAGFGTSTGITLCVAMHGEKSDNVESDGNCLDEGR